MVQIYQGYPVWVGFTARQMDGTMMSYQDPNSGYWNNDLLPTSLNVYRMDNRQLSPMSSGLNGTTLIRLDSQPDDYINPAKRCYQWAMVSETGLLCIEYRRFIRQRCVSA